MVGPFVSGGTRAELLQLLNSWATQEGQRFNATLELLDSNQQVVRTINYLDCIPTGYHPPSVRAGDDSLLEERFSCKPERIDESEQQVRKNSNELVKKNNEEILVSNNFRFEIDGQELEVLSVSPGAITADITEETQKSRTDNTKEFTNTKLNFDTWRVEKYYDQGDLTLKNMFEQFATGERKTSPEDSGTLIYQDRNGESARKITCYGITPVSYSAVNIDTQNQAATEVMEFAAVEVMEFSVTRCEYS